MLVQNADNLMEAVIKTMTAAESACAKVNNKINNNNNKNNESLICNIVILKKSNKVLINNFMTGKPYIIST